MNAVALDMRRINDLVLTDPNLSNASIDAMRRQPATHSRQIRNDARKIDGEETFWLEDFKWRVRFGYHITEYGHANSMFALSGDPHADGQCYEVMIMAATLLSPDDTVEQPLPLKIFAKDALDEYADIIGLILDEREATRE